MTKNIEKQNFKNAIAYIPFVAFVLYIIENNKVTSYGKHLQYGMILSGIWFLSLIILRGSFASLVTLAYWIFA